ncbi:MAG TPA: NUDIX hydrolase [Ignavibacteriales bacterium]|nr:NUDIX hydrolase [Ignavibacteriales bacterium]
MKNFKVVKSETLFRGKVFDLQVDEIEYNSGNQGVREIAIHPGGAVVVPVKDDGKVIFVRQFRYPLQKVLLELPAGKLEKGEDPMKCAVRELEEETGYKAGHITKLGSIYTTPGFCTEELHIYLATELTPGNHNREEGEHGMEVLEFTQSEIEEKIRSGELVDAKSLSGLLMAKSIKN